MRTRSSTCLTSRTARKPTFLPVEWPLLLGRQSRVKIKSPEPVSAKSLVEGFRFVYQSKIILGIITLDLFAVLLGGTVTLLPIYAKDIFHTGPSGLGWLRDAMRTIVRLQGIEPS